MDEEEERELEKEEFDDDEDPFEKEQQQVDVPHVAEVLQLPLFCRQTPTRRQSVPDGHGCEIDELLEDPLEPVLPDCDAPEDCEKEELN